MSIFSDLMRDSGRPALNAALDLYPHAITIMAQATTQDGYGQPLPSGAPTVFAEALAKVLDQAGGETLDANQVVAQADFTFEFLYVAGITSKMFVEMGSREFQILHVWSPGDRNVYTRLRVRERP